MVGNRYDDVNRAWDDRAFHGYAKFTDHPWRWALGGLATIAAVILVLNVLGVASVYWSAARSKATVGGRVTQSTYGTDNALRNIAYFHDQCNAILADAQNVVNAESTLTADEATFRATTDPIAQQQAASAVSQDQTALIGAKDQLSTDVRDYDSKSATQTADPFKAANLPARIDINPATGLLAGDVACH